MRIASELQQLRDHTVPALELKIVAVEEELAEKQASLSELTQLQQATEQTCKVVWAFRVSDICAAHAADC